MPFRRGDYKTFVRASIAGLELLQSATAADIAGCVPFINITQIHPDTGEVVNENIMKEIVGVSPFTDKVGHLFPERPNVSLQSLTVKTEQMQSAHTRLLVNIEFVVNRPNVVFSSDEYNAWRELLVEGNMFVLEYGWRSNTKMVKNEMLNGIGYYDRDSGMTVQSKTSLLIGLIKYTVNLEVNGTLRFSFEMASMGNTGMRHVSLFDELTNELSINDAVGPILKMKKLGADLLDSIDDAASKKKRIAKKQQSSVQLNDKLAKKVKEEYSKALIKKFENALQSRVISIDQKYGFVKDKRRFVRFGDIMDDLVAPILERMATRIGYKRIDLFFGNFNERCGTTSDNYGSEKMSGKSIGDFPIPVDKLKEAMSKTALKGREMRVESLVETLISIMRQQGCWKADAVRVPSLFTTSRDIPEDGRNVFVYAIIDGHDGSAIIESQGEEIASEDVTKEIVFNKLKEKGIPIIELGRVDSIFKSFDFTINPDQLQVKVFADRSLTHRKDQLQMVDQPDPQSLAGRSNRNALIPLSVLNGSIEMLGNFIFQTFSYVWVEFYGAHTITGIYNVKGRTDTIEAGNFSTTIELFSEGIDPFNTRNRLTATQLFDKGMKRLEDVRKQLIGENKSKKKNRKRSK